jgi:hypothetical protein
MKKHHNMKDEKKQKEASCFFLSSVRRACSLQKAIISQNTSS